MKTFVPDVIVEVTRVCDRRCRGCYAPNLLVSRAQVAGLKSDEDLFLDAENLRGALRNLAGSRSHPFDILTIRGGEPSLHPQLPELIKEAATFATLVYVETHGRWLAASSGSDSHMLAILEACRVSGAVLKVSYDSMHGLSGATLRTLLAAAEFHCVRWLVAITTTSMEAAEKITDAAPWLDRHQVIYQPLATRASELVRPRLGTVRCDGSVAAELTSKFSVEPASEVHP